MVNGRTIADDMAREHEYEQGRLRDTFAAAALTGMTSRVAGKAEAFAIAAYKLADAMLRERGQSDRSQPVRTPACHNPSQKNSPLTAEDTPATHATPGEGTVQERCTLTADERLAVLYFSGHYAGFYGRVMHGLAMRLNLYDLPRDTPEHTTQFAEGA